MKKIINLIFIVFLFTNLSLLAQSRSGLAVGYEYFTSSHTNPYVNIDINGNITSYTDVANHYYFPFGWFAYSKKQYAEVSTNAWHLLFVGILNMINPNKTQVVSLDHTYSGDSYADGYVPIFNDFGKNTGLTNIEASITDQDLLRFVMSGTTADWLPVMFGVQGGVGKLGVHTSKIEEDHEPSDVEYKTYGLATFNDGTDLYFGVNTGFVTSILNDDLALLSIQYDWYYFIKGTYKDEYQMNGNRLTFELTYFPFNSNSGWLSNLHFKGYYKTTKVPFMRDFSEKYNVDWEYSKIGLSVNYFIL